MQGNLTQLEYQILKYVSQFDSVTKADIVAHFAKVDIEVVEQHLKKLAEPLYHAYARTTPHPIPMTSYLSEFNYPLVCYRILPNGKTVLFEYEQQQAQQRKDSVFRLVTIIVASIAAVASVIAAVASIVAAVNSL